jgi:hypothetical protein
MENRPLYQLENEFLNSLLLKDKEGILEILVERPVERPKDTVFMRSVLNIIPENMLYTKTIIKRMTYSRPDKNLETEDLEQKERIES